ncbi:phage terminase large subunit [Xanthobacter sp. V3C-3]|uniref:phage terminase large subunit n=1 Tax=Xanthobacter lutulentifluminis TaxID=3119935 RepID=UPI003727CA95
MKPFDLTPRQMDGLRLMGGPQRHTLLAGGARSGKTFLITRSVVTRALRGAGSRHAVLRFRANAVRSSIALDTLPKVVRSCFPGLKLVEHRQDGFFELPNGSQIWLGGLDDKERVEKILGQEYCSLYFNECSQIPYSSILVARTRLAQVVPGLKQRAFYDLNPSGTGHWTYREFIEGRDPISGAPLSSPEEFEHMFLNPGDNAANLSEEFLKSLEALPEKQRRRFLEGRYVAEIDGALWTLDLIERCRMEPIQPGDARLGRIVIAVDPSGASAKEDERSDEIGVVVAGKLDDGTAVVLEDATVRDGPSGWGGLVARLFRKWGADKVIAERNYGGAMVEFVILTADKNIPVQVITASRGKHVRAEPVAALYEQGRVCHAGRFPEMEDQLTNFSTSGYVGSRSPDRGDALVWALTELMLDPDGFDPGQWIKAFG